MWIILYTKSARFIVEAIKKHMIDAVDVGLLFSQIPTLQLMMSRALLNSK